MITTPRTTPPETDCAAATAEQVRGLSLSVLRPADLGDCTLGGITATAARVTVVGVLDTTAPGSSRTDDVVPIEAGSRVVPARVDTPAVAVLVRARPFGPGVTLALVPVGPAPGTGLYRAAAGWSMFGGNYAVSSDSRWAELVGALTGRREARPLAVHDRFERR